MKITREKPNIGVPVIAGAVAVIAVIVAIAIGIIQGGSPGESSCKSTIDKLKAMENADATEIENQIRDLQQADQDKAQKAIEDEIMADESDTLLNEVQIRQTYQGTVIIGDSITNSIVEYGYLDRDVVVAQLGLSVEYANEQIDTAIGLNPSVIFMAFGANDLSLYFEDAEKFKQAYKVQTDKLKAALPDVPIYINCILPILPSRIEIEPELVYYPQYNEALQQLCDEEGFTYIDTSFIAESDPDVYEPDGEHVKGYFYPIWLTYMAEIAGIR
ncbi:MAG: SGNH/GDSL hydrolase family protein [Blautia sp.]|nr:SGNH/GDSL hydrolase family protein [Blautia sp.]